MSPPLKQAVGTQGALRGWIPLFFSFVFGVEESSPSGGNQRNMLTYLISAHAMAKHLPWL